MTDSRVSNIEELFRTHYRALCLYATHIVGSTEAAEDIVMDCFVKLHERLERGEQILSPRSYLYQMTRNASLDNINRYRGEVQAEKLPDLPDNDDELVEQSEREARLWEEINRLPKACREILLLSKREGLKNREVADRLGISIKTVEAQLTKAYKTLRGKAGKIYMMFF